MKKIIFFFVFLMLLLASAQDNQATPQRNEPTVYTENSVYDMVTEKSKFIGGEDEQVKFIKNNLKYPVNALKNGIQGTVFIKFIVERDGSINKNSVEVRRTIDPELDAEAVRVVKLMPNWTIPRQQDKPVRQNIIIPVRFRISK